MPRRTWCSVSIQLSLLIQSCGVVVGSSSRLSSALPQLWDEAGLIARVVCLPPWWQAAVFHPVGVAIAPLFGAMGRVIALVSRLDGRPDERPMLVVAWHHGRSGKQRSTRRCAFA